jgi:hypothetical protein
MGERSTCCSGANGIFDLGRGKAMIKRMLVPVRENRLRQVAPQLKEIISPEWQIVFLLRYLSEKHGLSVSDVSSPDGLLKLNGFRVSDNERQYAWNTSLDAGNEGRPTEQTSCDAGAKITVDLFSGSLKSALKRYLTDSQVQLVMLPCGPLRRWINGPFRHLPTLSFFQGDPLLAVLLLEPKDLNDRSLSIFLSGESNWC